MDLDIEYQNGKIFKRNNNNYLPFIIDRKPKGLKKATNSAGYEEKIFKECNASTIHRQVLSKKFSRELGIKWNIGLCLIFSLFLPLLLNFGGHGSLDTVYNFILIGIGILFLIPTYKNWTNSKNLPEKISIIFDRQNGTIILPKIDHVDSFKIPFNHLKANRINIGYTIYQVANKPQLMFYNEPNKRTFDDGYIDMSLMYSHDDAQETWSYYVWYMDKYRPLPPGQAFDPYRQQDFERRRAEGFPAPLYKSVVPTLEATPEQQLEREKFWKDEDHMVDASEAKFSLLAGAFSEKKRKKMKKKRKKKAKESKKKNSKIK